MNCKSAFLLIPSFPFKPSVNQVIYVERRYNKQINTILSLVTSEEEYFLFIPSVERKFYDSATDDEFYSQILPEIDDLYDFLDDAKVGTPFTDIICWDSDPFEEYKDTTVDDIVQCGLINYTGKKHFGDPVFSYFPLEFGSIDNFINSMNLSNHYFAEIHRRLRPRREDTFQPAGPMHQYLIMDRGDHKVYKYKNYFDYKKARLQLGYIEYDNEDQTIEEGATTRTVKKWNLYLGSLEKDRETHGREIFSAVVNLTPVEMAVYSYFIQKYAPIEISEICTETESAKIQDLYSLKFFGNSRIKINDDWLRKRISDINKKIESELMRFISKDDERYEEKMKIKCAPFVISQFAGEGYGILMCCRKGSYYLYLQKYRKKLKGQETD